MNRLIRATLASALLVGLAGSVWGASVFYQPQTRDAAIEDAAWQAIWRDMQSSGYDGLVVQWTRFNHEDFGGAEGWLGSVVESAMAAGLQVRLGLYWDDQWFTSLAGDGRAWGDRLNLWLQRSLDQARDWQVLTDRAEFVGWYLPLELPDRGLQNAARREILAQQIGRLAEALNAPLAVSSYFTGYQAPTDYVQWLDRLAERTGATHWVQDGAGTGQLSEAERALYLDALDCSHGIVHEAFEQTSEGEESFSARPRRLASSVGSECHETLIFSLRYLGVGQALPR